MIPSHRTVLWRIVLLCVAARVVLEAIGLASLAAHGHSTFANGIKMWSSWDAPHYLRVAEVGYKKSTPPPDDPLFIVFFPFFPLAVRIVAVAARDLVLSGILVSLAASVGGLYFLYRLALLDVDHAEAWRAVILLVAFPTAYFLAAPYSEALFLFAVVACVYAARTSRWGRAGLAGALATGTRVSGVALAPALVVEALSTPAKTSERLRRFGWTAVAGAGLLVYLAINKIVYGDPFWFLTVQRSHWFQQAVPPWRSITDAVHGLAHHPDTSTTTFIYVGRIAGVVFAVPLLLLAARRLRIADSAYAWTSLVLFLSASWLLSLPRYLLVLYPLFLVGARFTRARVAFWVVVAAGAATQSWLFWRYAVGEWTF